MRETRIQKEAEFCSTHVRGLSKCLLYIFLLSPAELAWSQVIKQVCESDRGCPVIEVSSF
jgi:hypothetical protein